MKDRFKVVPSVYLLMIRGGKILLMRRFKTGYFDGYYGLPAGHLEKEEMPAGGTIREAYEEAGVRLKKEDLRFVHLLYRMSNIPVPHERADFFFCGRTMGRRAEKYGAGKVRRHRLVSARSFARADGARSAPGD